MQDVTSRAATRGSDCDERACFPTPFGLFWPRLARLRAWMGGSPVPKYNERDVVNYGCLWTLIKSAPLPKMERLSCEVELPWYFCLLLSRSL